MLEPVVQAALGSLDGPECDRAMVALALAYARAIDADAFLDEPTGALAALGPKLRDCLESLHASAAARARAKSTAATGPLAGSEALRRLRSG